MTRILTCIGVAAFFVGALAAQRQDPEHPWPDHEPPPDYVCVVARDAKAVKTNINACSCLGMMLEKMCPETEEETQARINSSLCKSWCKPKQCKCGAQCQDSEVLPLEHGIPFT